MTRTPSGLRAFARQRAAWVWLGFMAAAALVTWRSHFVADLSAFLPSTPTPTQAVLLEQLNSGAAARVVLIGIEGGTAPARTAASQQLAQAMRASGAFASVHNGDSSQWQAAGQFLFEHRYLLSPAVDAERFSVQGLRDAIDETVALLGTPAGAMIKPIVLRDPTGETVRIAEALLPAQAPRSEGGVWVSRQAPRAVLVATTRAEGGNLDAQERALALLRQGFEPHAAQGLQLTLSGAPVFGVHARAQIKSEVERLALVTGAAIAALLWLAFGTPRALLAALLPVASGVLAGIAAVSLGFGRVHGMTLGFGITLIGEAVDYAIYYLIQARSTPGAATPGAQRWVAQSWPTVRLGLWTSLCGFAALAFSGFPGLAQLGVFSIVGLSAAALTMRYLLPLALPDGAPSSALRHRLGRLTARATAALPRLRGAVLLLALAALAALWLLPSPWRGDLASLSPIDASMQARDAALRADLGEAEAGTLLVALAAPDEAQALALAEAAGARLDALVAKGLLQGYESPAHLLPSPATQALRRAALPDAGTLRERLAQATAQGPLKAERLGAFVDDVQAARRQPFLDRKALQDQPLAGALDALLVPGRDAQPWHALLNLRGSAGKDAAPALRTALADLPGAQVLDIKHELDALYARYLREAMLQALLGAAAVCALLGWSLRSWRRLWRVAEPIAAAVVLVLAALAASGATLGILHLVGFLLVVAVGSNYALFFERLRDQVTADEDTLASLVLANLTMVLSFGVLAASSIPALHAIGMVVAPGALLCLLCSAALMGPRRSRG